MLAAELTIFCLITVLFLGMGLMIGWIAKSHSYDTQFQKVFVHPEMFDGNGNIIPDEILAVRFEEGFFDEEEVEEED